MPELGSEVTLAALTVYVVLVVLPLLSVVVELSTVTFVPPFTTVELPLFILLTRSCIMGL